MRAARASRRFVRIVGIAVAAMSLGSAAHADRIAFVVPGKIIYPGQTVDGTGLQEKLFTIKASAAGNYILSTDQIIGKVARKTLLPGQPIMVSAVNEPDLIERGVPVVLVYSTGSLVITAKGVPMEPGHAGDLIKVRNTDSGIIVSGTVLADGTVQVGMQ